MKILITGGNGRIGSYLLEHSFKQDNVLVVGKGYIPQYENTNHQFNELDLLDKKAFANIFAQFTPEKVIHLAGIMGANCESDELLCKSINIGITKSVTELALKNGTKQIVFASTSAVYELAPYPVTESEAVNPVSIYGKTKLAAERILQDYASIDCKVTILRMFNVYGPGLADSLINKLQESALKGPVTLIDPDIFIRDYVHMHDIAKVYESAIRNLQQNDCEIINVCTGIPLSTSELLKLLKAKGYNIKYQVSHKLSEQSYSCGSAQKLSELYKIKPLPVSEYV